MMSSRRIFAENPPIPQNSRSFSRLREFRHTIEPRTRTSDRRRLSLGCRGHGSPARIDFAVEGVIAFGRTAPVEIERHRGSAHLLEVLRRLVEIESLRNCGIERAGVGAVEQQSGLTVMNGLAETARAMGDR